MYKLSSLLILLASLPAHAQLCGPVAAVCARFDKIPILFRGRALKVSVPSSPGSPITYPDGSSTMIYAVPMSEEVRFEVLEVFKGSPEHEVTILGSNGQFHEGSEYLVIASPDARTNELNASICSGTRPLTVPSAATDLAWLRAYPTAPPTSEIFGKVSMAYETKNIPAISLTLTGPETRTATTSEANSYSFKSLPPGTYTLMGTVPVGYTTGITTPRAVTVAAKSCAELDWYVQPDTHVRGSVVSQAGTPASKVLVGLLIPSSTARSGFTLSKYQETDASGHYDFSGVASQDYWVAIYPFGPSNQQPHATVFYPAASALSEAESLNLPFAGTLADINFIQPPALHPLTLSLQVNNQDGTPVVRGHVIAIEPGSSQAISAITDESGHADITLYEGRLYSLVANTSGNREPACAGPVKFIATEGLMLNTLILDKTFQACRALQMHK